MYSLVIPVYKNEASLPRLLQALGHLNDSLQGALEVVFVVDGSPDNSAIILRREMAHCKFLSILVLHSRNFGAYAAIRTGLREATGPCFAVMAADLQEPPELILRFFEELKREAYDVVVGARQERSDPFLSKVLSSLFWRFYRSWVQPEMPPGGIDVFACNRVFRDALLGLQETNSSLVGLVMWMGFRRRVVPYKRLERTHGVSAWTFHRKWRYFTDSVFSFSDLPIRLLTATGALALGVFFILGLTVVAVRWFGNVRVPGYTATVLVVLFFGALNCFGIGIVGGYVWRAFENTKGRPPAFVLQRTRKGENSA